MEKGTNRARPKHEITSNFSQQITAKGLGGPESIKVANLCVEEP